MISQVGPFRPTFPRQSPKFSERQQARDALNHPAIVPSLCDTLDTRSLKLLQWLPPTEYTGKDVNDLEPGPGCISVTGRIVNFFEMATTSKSEAAAKGFFKLIVKDDTGALMVSLSAHLASPSRNNADSDPPRLSYGMLR